MTDLIANTGIKYRGLTKDRLLPAAAQHLYIGMLVMINAAGYVAKATATASSQFAGVVLEECDNSAGNAGDKNVRVAMDGEHLLTVSDTLTVANNGDTVYATDSGTATVTSATNAQKVGVLTQFVSASKAWVSIIGGVEVPALGS